MRQQNNPARRLLRITPSAAKPLTVIELQTQPGGVSAAGGVVWLSFNGGLARIDAGAIPRTPTIAVDLASNWHAAFAGGVWVSERHANRVAKIC